MSNQLNLSGWLERRKLDLGPYSSYVIKSVVAYEEEIKALRERLDNT